jgi:hypothetical protein
MVPSKRVGDCEPGVRSVPVSRPLVDLTMSITISMWSMVIGRWREVPRDDPSDLGFFPRVPMVRPNQGGGYEYQPETH